MAEPGLNLFIALNPRMRKVVALARRLSISDIRPFRSELAKSRECDMAELAACARRHSSGARAPTRVHPPVSLDEALKCSEGANRIFFCERDATQKLDSIVLDPSLPIYFFIGGICGFASDEIARIRACVGNAITLGPRVLTVPRAVALGAKSILARLRSDNADMTRQSAHGANIRSL